MKIGKLNIDAIEYASQGNAILGIRDSGKTYTGTYIAEQLMENKIPIIAFDPIGVWRYLKVGQDGKKGYPIVVAGDGGDLPLTPESAPDIVRSAMRENVSLVIDLYSMALSKSDWKKIVASCIRLLLYENKNYGLRHIFIEEASEFAPQRVRPDEGVVYAEIEKLARMGGNASLGYTLINQRAEEVNKAVLELCDCLFLHRQKGRNSLTALGKWLDIADAKGAKNIIKTLPSLEQGKCWVWLQGSHDPELISIPKKNTVHPDRRNPLKLTSGATADVTEFVERMKKSIELTASAKQATPEKKSKSAEKSHQNNADESKAIAQLSSDKADLESKCQNLKTLLSKEEKLRKDAEQKLDTVRKMLSPQYEQMKKIMDEAQAVSEESMSGNGEYGIWLDKFSGKPKAMLELIIKHRRLDRRKWCLLAGVSYNSSGFDSASRQFQQLKLIAKEGNDFVLQQIL